MLFLCVKFIVAFMDVLIKFKGVIFSFVGDKKLKIYLGLGGNLFIILGGGVKNSNFKILGVPTAPQIHLGVIIVLRKYNIY